MLKSGFLTSWATPATSTPMADVSSWRRSDSCSSTSRLTSTAKDSKCTGFSSASRTSWADALTQKGRPSRRLNRTSTSSTRPVSMWRAIRRSRSEASKNRSCGPLRPTTSLAWS